jgi:L-lactate dehydrogenase
MVIGEHGTSEVFLWSSIRVGGLTFDQACAVAGLTAAEVRQDIEDDVRYANITIIEGNDASQYGIGIVCARLAQAVLRDEQIVFPIANFHSEYGLTLSLPSVLGRAGVSRSFVPTMTETEQVKFQHGIEQLTTARQRIGAAPAM